MKILLLFETKSLAFLREWRADLKEDEYIGPKPEKPLHN